MAASLCSTGGGGVGARFAFFFIGRGYPPIGARLSIWRGACCYLVSPLRCRGMDGICVKTGHKREKACNFNNVTFSPWYVSSSFVRSFRVRTVRKGGSQPALLSPYLSEGSPSLKNRPRIP